MKTTSIIDGVAVGTTAVRPVALTGDRTTGALHLGHYAGSLRARVAMQDTHDLHVMLADTQAMTDNGRDPGRLRANEIEVMADYLAVGIDPARTTILLQSGVHALARLSMHYLTLVSVARLERNPTVRSEMEQKGYGRDVPAGFLCYPAAQAADITAFKATVVPVGEDQLPMIEISNELVARVNRIAGRELLPTSKALLSRVTRLPGVDGRAKASKSLGNAIALGASKEDVAEAVRSMFTDPSHVRVSDPGRVEGNVVFDHLVAFDPDQEEVEALKEHYRRGGLGDMALKRRLATVLEDMLGPIRERRAHFAARPDDMMDMLRDGTRRAAAEADRNVREIEDALGLTTL